MTKLPPTTRAKSTGDGGALIPAVGGLIALAISLGIGRFVYTPILPVMTAALGLSKWSAGLIASANFAGYLVGALAATAPGLPGRRRLWLTVGLAGSAVTTAAMGLARGMTAFLALRFLGGVASALVLVFASALLLDYMARRGRSGFNSVLFAGVGTGITVSAILVSLLRLEGQSWTVLWLASGLLSGAGAIAAAKMIPDEPAQSAAGANGHSPVRGKPLPAIVLAYGLFGFGYVITATFLVAIVRAAPAIRQLEPLVWIVVGIAAVPSVALWNRLAGRIGLMPAFALAALVEAVGVIASIAWPTTAGVFVASVFVGGTFMGLTALGLMRGRELARGNSRQVLGLMTSAFSVGQIIGPSFAGFVFDRTNSFAAPSIAAAVALAIAAACALMSRDPIS